MFTYFIEQIKKNTTHKNLSIESKGEKLELFINSTLIIELLFRVTITQLQGNVNTAVSQTTWGNGITMLILS